jgi:N-acetylmuramoyl-L-alanine amidase
MLLCLFLLVACTPQDEARLKAIAEQTRQTAVARGKEYLATEAPKVKETALAEGKKAVATAVPQIKGTAAAAVGTEAARARNSLRKVVLDPGHGWRGESGASYFDLLEKDVNLKIALQTQQALERDGYRVTLTRTADDPEHDLAYAAQVANAQKPDLVVSIHANAAGVSASGTEACYTVGKRTDEQSKRLAKLLTSSIATRLELPEIGVFPENSAGKCARTASTGWTQLYIHDMDAPTALIETAFLSNRGDAKLLSERPGDFARAIAGAIEQYFELPGR